MMCAQAYTLRYLFIRVNERSPIGLFNHLFGGKRGLAKELTIDADKRVALWNAHVKNYADRHDLAKSFHFGRVDTAIADWPSLITVLDQIEASISKDLVTVETEEAVDSEILDDLRRFASMESADETIMEFQQKRLHNRLNLGILSIYQFISS